MQVQDQSAAIAFLSDPATHGGRAVETVETHISHIFLTGDRAYKLKRAVHLPYADFSTPQIRLDGCRKELALNSAITPDLYRRVRRITRTDAGLAFDGDGDLVDAVLEMERFDQTLLLDRMATDGRLSAPLMREVADVVAAAHEQAPVVEDESGAENIAGVLDINHAGFGESHVFSDAEVAEIDSAFRDGLERHRDLLDRRARDGALRRCHGDLHLRNICLFRGRPRLFDCIDFSDRLATVDVLYDLAFLAMDLWHREMTAYANLVVNRYLDAAGGEDGFALLPYFTALRAAVRAHVTATQAEEGDDDKARAARAYYDLALAHLRPAPPRLVAVGGLSGSGKTTVAEALAPHLGAPPGARLLESDRLRKAMFGVPSTTRLPDSAYTPETSDKVYGEMATRAGALLASGAAVVADAVYDRPDRRAAIRSVAESAGVPFQGVWLQAAPEVLRRRLEARQGSDSDATTQVLDAQLRRDPGAMDWIVLSAETDPDDTAAAIRDTRARTR
ncbi:AAA family ATPase [Psychromarinibacter sp. C21-152]|uniref:AAA family ATPase n=1 Tax=Psychromarinibacter sediminicola TaxID=3033385 RepID=A0AAE3NN04_9RHOB|nr:bifunctional aminoglycoside phosphotransferase/ATP-binding protein [Psychromarinibacter sediminicola]MDF0600313.1 AAA family ATPase [Psychromarinibacter sediminicola]